MSANRDYTADRDLFRDLDSAIERNRMLLEDEEQMEYLRKWGERHNDAGGCMPVVVCIVVGLSALVALIGGIA